MSQVSRYHPLLVTLHWLLALMIIAALALGTLVLVKIPNSDPMKIDALRQHVTGGVLILALMLVRLLVRTRTTHPAPASAGNARLNKLGWASHRLFYPLVIGMAGSGLIMAVRPICRPSCSAAMVPCRPTSGHSRHASSITCFRDC